MANNIKQRIRKSKRHIKNLELKYKKDRGNVVLKKLLSRSIGWYYRIKRRVVSYDRAIDIYIDTRRIDKAMVGFSKSLRDLHQAMINAQMSMKAFAPGGITIPTPQISM